MSNTIVIYEIPKFRIEMDTDPERAVIRPSGIINEDVNFNSVIDLLKTPEMAKMELIFDLGQVQRLNSCGIREWLMFIERVPNQKPLVFTNIPLVFVEQANMISSTFGNKKPKIASFELPYFCSACHSHFLINAKIDQLRKVEETIMVPIAKCAKCGSVLHFDAMEEQYFNFLEHTLGS